MFCGNCGREIKEEWAVCPQCGVMLKSIVPENVNEKRSRRKRNPLWIIAALVAFAIVIWMFIPSGEALKEKEQEVIEKLQTFTISYEEDEKVYFADQEEKWILTYNEVNEFVSFKNDTVIGILEEVFGTNPYSEGSVSEMGFIYDISDDEARVYLDVDIEEGHLSTISYNIGEQEYTLSVDGEHWTATDEFVELMDSYGLPKIMENDVNYFNAVLEEHGIEMNSLLDVNYETLMNLK